MVIGKRKDVAGVKFSGQCQTPKRVILCTSCISEIMLEILLFEWTNANLLENECNSTLVIFDSTEYSCVYDKKP